MRMTDKQIDLYNETVKRLLRMGVKTPVARIIALAEEIEHYRNKICWLEERLKVHDSANGHQPQKEAKTAPPDCGSSIQPPIYTQVLQKPAKEPEKTTAEVIEALERHIEQYKEVFEMLAPGVPSHVLMGAEIDALACIKSQRTQIERQSGRWAHRASPRRFAPISDEMKCSVCDGIIERMDGVNYHYCPNCGARMEG